jgi:hypothetical protein
VHKSIALVIAILAAASCSPAIPTGERESALNKASGTCLDIVPPGAIGARWKLTGGLAGPLGCPVSAAQTAPGGTGQVMQFQNGQIVSAPNQGTNMSVAVYQQAAYLMVDWGDTAPFNYDKFLIRWTFNGADGGQVDVPPQYPQLQGGPVYVLDNPHRTRGIWSLPTPSAGTYTISIEGCDNGTFGSTCRQGWTIPATITYVPPPPPVVTNDCKQLPAGPIRDRWLALGGQKGPLGCPISGVISVPGTNGQVVTFVHGQIGLAPSQGTNLTVAAYQVESDVAVEWGPTDPFSYDKFNVLWNKDGQTIVQNEVDPSKDYYGTRVYSGPNNHGIDRVRGVGPGAYTVSVEGCDNGTFGSTCRQGFTFPLTVNVRDGIGYNSSCGSTYTVSGVIGDRWSHLVGPGGPLLGCPTGPVVANGGGTSQTFQKGQIVASPPQGGGLTVAFYQQGAQLALSWGDTFPFNYDKFIVRVNGAQADITNTDGSKMSGGTAVFPYAPTDPAPTPNTTYTAIIEGCDVSLGSSTCRQGWTVPVQLTYVAPPTNPPPDFYATIDFSSLTPATTAADAGTQIAQRERIVSQYNGCRKTLGDVFGDEEDFMNGAIGKLDLVANNVRVCQAPYTVRPVDLRSEVNSALRFQQIKSKPGSTSDNGLCPRTGEYDVALTGYITILYRFGALLDNDVRNHILNDLLDERGPVDSGEFSFCSGVPETENHLNQMESARYLTNQLLYSQGGDQLFDNESNGMNDYMLARLQSFLQHDFIEYNSKPYQTYSINAIQNLYDFAVDRRVKMAAWLVLDYISAKYAASSNFLRRNAPYRRRISHYSTDLLDFHSDANNGRFTFLTGMFQINNEFVPANHLSFGHSEDMQMLAVSSYRAPESILDLIMNQSHRSFYQRIKHDGVEIYASRPDYLITAGGYWMGSPYSFLGMTSSDDEGAVVPTTLMPSDDITDSSNMIHIDGLDTSKGVDERNRLNTCVAPDFACGYNLRIPANYSNPDRREHGCYEEVKSPITGGTFIFIDSSTYGCDNDAKGNLRPYGFYVAAYVSGPVDGDNFGFFEAHPRDPNLTFVQFQQGVLQRNQNTRFGDAAFGTPSNSYVMTSGQTVQFTIPVETASKYNWTVLGTGDSRLDALGNDIGKWPLASGDILTSDGNNGLVIFDNPKTGQHIYLDFSDVGEPKRTEISFGPIH